MRVTITHVVSIATLMGAAGLLVYAFSRPTDLESSATTEELPTKISIEESSPQAKSPSVVTGMVAEATSSMRAALGKRRVTKSANAPRLKGDIEVVRSLFSDLPEKDRKVCEALQTALEAEDFQQVLDTSAAALISDNPEVRLHAIDALGWFGADALPELTPMLSDKDETVAQQALNAWESGLSEVEEPEIRLQVAAMALRAVIDKDALISIGGQYANAATELIDANEGMTSDAMRIQVVQQLADMIESGSKSGDLAGREAYESITGYEWRGFDEAERYLKDPDNYELPEDREPAQPVEPESVDLPTEKAL